GSPRRRRRRRAVEEIDGSHKHRDRQRYRPQRDHLQAVALARSPHVRRVRRPVVPKHGHRPTSLFTLPRVRLYNTVASTAIETGTNQSRTTRNWLLASDAASAATSACTASAASVGY